MVAMTSEIVKAVKIPVTVKTRLGWDENTIRIEEVVERLQDVGIQAISIHARTRKQMYKGHADWSYLAKIKKNPRIQIPVFGNGDIDTPEKAVEYREKYGIDGMKIGRASIGYSWIYKDIKYFMATGEKLPAPDLNERLRVTKSHLDSSIKWTGEKLGILEMRRQDSNYFRGMPNFKPYRSEMVTADSYAEVCALLEEVAEQYADYQWS